MAAVPYGALPLGSVAAVTAGLPLLYTRKKVKKHGSQRQVEGHFEQGDRVVVVEDLVSTGAVCCRLWGFCALPDSRSRMQW